MDSARSADRGTHLESSVGLRTGPSWKGDGLSSQEPDLFGDSKRAMRLTVFILQQARA